MKQIDKDKNEESLMDELKSYGSILSRQPSGTSGDIPADYFAKMQEDVLEKIQTVDTSGRRPIVRFIRLGLSIAAAIAVFFVARNVLVNDTNNGDFFTEASSTELLDYLENDAMQSDVDLIFESELLTEEDLEAIINEEEWSNDIMEPLLEDEEWVDRIFENI